MSDPLSDGPDEGVPTVNRSDPEGLSSFNYQRSVMAVDSYLVSQQEAISALRDALSMTRIVEAYLVSAQSEPIERKEY